MPTNVLSSGLAAWLPEIHPSYVSYSHAQIMWDNPYKHTDGRWYESEDKAPTSFFGNLVCHNPGYNAVVKFIVE